MVSTVDADQGATHAIQLNLGLPHVEGQRTMVQWSGKKGGGGEGANFCSAPMAFPPLKPLPLV